MRCACALQQNVPQRGLAEGKFRELAISTKQRIHAHFHGEQCGREGSFSDDRDVYCGAEIEASG
jgi:hypothetical protein